MNETSITDYFVSQFSLGKAYDTLVKTNDHKLNICLTIKFDLVSIGLNVFAGIDHSNKQN